MSNYVKNIAFSINHWLSDHIFRAGDSLTCLFKLVQSIFLIYGFKNFISSRCFTFSCPPTSPFTFTFTNVKIYPILQFFSLRLMLFIFFCILISPFTFTIVQIFSPLQNFFSGRCCLSSLAFPPPPFCSSSSPSPLHTGSPSGYQVISCIYMEVILAVTYDQRKVKGTGLKV